MTRLMDIGAATLQRLQKGGGSERTRHRKERLGGRESSERNHLLRLKGKGEARLSSGRGPGQENFAPTKSLGGE